MRADETRELFDRLCDGDEAAAQAIFDQYVLRLIALARENLSARMAGKVEADDIVQSAMRTFFVRARGGQFTIERSGDLWRLLAAITRRKVLKQAEHFRQQKRDVRRDRSLDFIDSRPQLTATTQPTHEEGIALADEVTRLLRILPSTQGRILQLRLQGLSVPEIAAEVDRSERTVRTSLQQLHTIFSSRLDGLRE